MRRFYEDIPEQEEAPVRKRWTLSEKTKDRLAGFVAFFLCLIGLGIYLFFRTLPGLPTLVRDIGYLIEDIQRFFGW